MRKIYYTNATLKPSSVTPGVHPGFLISKYAQYPSMTMHTKEGQSISQRLSVVTVTVCKYLQHLAWGQ